MLSGEQLSIGEFSKLTGLTIKTLRFYHESGLIRPICIDPENGYRYYSTNQLDLARAIKTLRELGCSIDEISSTLKTCDDGESLIDMLEKRRDTMVATMKEDRSRLLRLEEILAIERQAERRTIDANFEVRETSLKAQHVASIRHRGAYSECGRQFGKLARQYGRFLAGKPMILCWDSEYKDADASYEVAFPVRPCKAKSESQVYSLDGGSALTLMHAGPYDELYRSYQKLFIEASRRGWRYRLPTREIYHKGPGMIFRGNPQKYMTEIQIIAEVQE